MGPSKTHAQTAQRPGSRWVPLRISWERVSQLGQLCLPVFRPRVFCVVFDTNTLTSAFLLPQSIPRQTFDVATVAGHLLFSSVDNMYRLW